MLQIELVWENISTLSLLGMERHLNQELLLQGSWEDSRFKKERPEVLLLKRVLHFKIKNLKTRVENIGGREFAESLAPNVQKLLEGFAFSHCTTCKAQFHLRVELFEDNSWRKAKFRLFVARDVFLVFLAVQTVIAGIGGFAYIMDKDGNFRNSFDDGWDRILSKTSYTILLLYCNDPRMAGCQNCCYGWGILDCFPASMEACFALVVVFVVIFALCLLRLYRKNPDVVNVYGWADWMAQLLDERDLGVLTSSMSLLVANQDIPQEYTYYSIPSPWLQCQDDYPADPRLSQENGALATINSQPPPADILSDLLGPLAIEGPLSSSVHPQPSTTFELEVTAVEATAIVPADPRLSQENGALTTVNSQPPPADILSDLLGPLAIEGPLSSSVHPQPSTTFELEGTAVEAAAIVPAGVQANSVQPIGNISERFQALCVKDSGVLYEDPYIQIGVKAKCRAHHGHMVLFLGNKNAAPCLCSSYHVASHPFQDGALTSTGNYTSRS
ncbi:hypothetical protein PIB30_083117 [Stylosanthes scabra]|uniref:Uncharacterized protein n=1 Tax=Stylosanthes scabra TaxID=79078 RepID=A0ABU6ZR14_9FABA|nr:hypothetical protein [Stylosanthes scabra]